MLAEGLGARQWFIAAANNTPAPYALGSSVTTTNTSDATTATKTFPQSYKLKSDTTYAFYFNATLPVDANPAMQSKALLTALSVGGDGYLCPLLATDNTGNVGTTPDVRSVGNNIGFFYSYASANWQAFVSVAGTPTQIDTGVVVAINTPYVFKILVNFGSGSATFYINGTAVGTISTLPVTNTFFYIGAWGSYVSVTSATVMDVASIYCEAY